MLPHCVVCNHTLHNRHRLNRPPRFTACPSIGRCHWRRLVRNIGWENQNIGGAKGGKCKGDSQLLGSTCPGCPQSLRLWQLHPVVSATNRSTCVSKTLCASMKNHMQSCTAAESFFYSQIKSKCILINSISTVYIVSS